MTNSAGEIEQLREWDRQKSDRLAQNADCMELAAMVLEAPPGSFANRQRLAARILRQGLASREPGEPWI